MVDAMIISLAEVLHRTQRERVNLRRVHPIPHVILSEVEGSGGWWPARSYPPRSGGQAVDLRRHLPHAIGEAFEFVAF